MREQMNSINCPSTVISGKDNEVTLRSQFLKERCRLTLIGDYHATLDDERGTPFKQYSARMAQWGHSDMQELESLFSKAFQDGSDAIILLGDILSFPTEKGVETLAGMMKDSPIPVLFTAGNHDWHYEGMPGSDMQKRQKWISKRLLPLYGGHDPMNYAFEIKGVKILMVDNSVYEITPSQLEFCRKELSDGKPVLVGCHIPLYLGMPYHTIVNYGCGNPEWNGANDPYFAIERRKRWAKEGQSAETFAFCRELLESENLLGIAAGHTHTYCLETFNNKFQLVISSLSSATLTMYGN